MRFAHCLFSAASLQFAGHVCAAEPSTLGTDSPPVPFTFQTAFTDEPAFTFQARLKPVDDAGHLFVRNADGSLIGCTFQPATKTGHVYLFLTRRRGDVLLMRDLNLRLAELFRRRLPRGFERDCVILERIEGRTLVLFSTVYLARLPTVKFRVHVSEDGELTLVR